jgi:hypothetical protein
MSIASILIFYNMPVQHQYQLRHLTISKLRHNEICNFRMFFFCHKEVGQYYLHFIFLLNN